MTAYTCQAAEFLRSRGPAPIPLRACCAAAVIRSAAACPPATNLSSAPFVCAAAGLTIPPDARRADDPAAAGTRPAGTRPAGTRPAGTRPAGAGPAGDPAGVGAEQIR